MARQFTSPKTIITGNGSLETAKEHIKNIGKKVFIVTGRTVVTLDCFKNVIAMLDEIGVEYEIFTGITGEPTDIMINDGVVAYKNSGCDFMMAVGGGSPIDSMKAIATLVVNGGEIADFSGKEITGDMPAMIAIPTTAGTGSEATQFTVITDTQTGVKMLLKGICLIPQIAIVDAQFSMSSPKGVTAGTGLDALTHAIESYTSKKAQPLSDSVAISAVKRIFKYLPIAYNDGTNTEARQQMAIASLEGGMAINNASTTIVHGMSRPIGANFHVPHGISNAMLLTTCLNFAKDAAYDKFADLARAIGVCDYQTNDIIASGKLLIAIEELCKLCDVKSITEYGIDKDEFLAVMDKMADDALASGSPTNTIKTITKDDILRLYKEVL